MIQMQDHELKRIFVWESDLYSALNCQTGKLTLWV